MKNSTTTAGLEAVGLVKRFGGVTAVDGISFEAPVGRITGLIGPNGAGKSTTFDLCSGLTRPTAGAVMFKGTDVTSVPVSERARRGLGRTFQQTRLFRSMTVRENVEVGHEAGIAGRNPLRLLLSRPTERHAIRDAADEAIELCGLADLVNRPAGSLSTGQRRLVELARVLAGGFDLLLLDEPSAGLDPAETTQFGDVLEQAVASRGTGLLLVEHDIDLVMRLCEHIYVIDFGRPIFDGTPQQVQHSSVVRAAYLGAEREAS